jgi:trimeric autotransporter adhesin
MAYQPKSYRKFVATAATATLVASAVAPAASAAELSDIAGHRHAEAINALVEQNIISGYPDGTFRPDVTVTRGEAAIMIARAKGLIGEGETPKVDFSDVTASSKAYEAIAKLADKGIISGYEDGTYRPDKKVKRGEMAVILTKAFDLELGDGEGTPFTDVSSKTAVGPYVEAIYNAKITNGVKTNSFGVSQETKRGDFAKFVYEAMEIKEDPKDPEVIEVTSVSAINATTISVTFSNEETAEITLEQALEDGLNTISFQYNGQTFTDVEVTYYAPTEVELSVKSAEARSNTEVTVVLAEAPLTNLKASDFKISPALNITSVTTNNNVVTLKTAPQQNGTEYTVTPVNGSGSATFTGLEDVSAQGIIDSVEILNNRQIKVNFNTEVNYSTVNTGNVYLGLTENDDAYGLAPKSLDSLSIAADDTANWVVKPATALTDDERTAEGDGETIYRSSFIIESTGNEDLTGLGLKYNENATVEVRNVEDANGYTNTSQGAFTWVDTKAPTIETDAVVVNDGGVADLTINFSEPVNPQASNPDYKLYIDGVLVDPAIYTDVLDGGNTVSDHTTATLDVSGLEKDVEHEIKIVGAEDLQGNVQAVNPYTSKFIIQDKAAEAPDMPEKAAVTDVKQTADNVFDIYFNQENVVPHVDVADDAGTAAVDESEVKILTVKEANWFDGKWNDLVIYTNEAGEFYYKAATDSTKVPADIEATTLDGETKWTVVLDAALDKTTTTEHTFNFDAQKVVARDVIVENYIVSEATSFPNAQYFEGTQYKEFFSFQHDTLAPVVGQTDYIVADGKLFVSFNDAPFNGIIDLVAGKGIKVSKTDKNGVTKDLELNTTTHAANITVGDGTGTDLAAGKYVEIDLAAIAAGGNADAIALLTATPDFDLVRGDVYTVNFAEGAITDADRQNVVNTADEETVSGPSTSVASSVSISIPTVETGTSEGAVPQTTPFMIATGVDIENGALANLDAGTAANVGTVAYMTADTNKDKIIAIFEGEVLESSALNKQNYSFNGQPLTAGSTVTFYQEDIQGDDTKENFVIIDLEAGTVDKDGLYTVSVKDITNKTGKRMLPVNDSVALTDNTLAVGQTLKVIGSKQIEVKFNEEVTAAAGAENNFAVTVNGQTYGVATVTQPTDKTKLVLTLTQDFEFEGAKAVVTVKKDANGKMFIEDNAGNEAAANVRLAN